MDTPPGGIAIRPRAHSGSAWALAGALGTALLIWGVALLSMAGEVGRPFPGFFTNPEYVVSGFTPHDYTGPQAGLRPWDRITAVNGRNPRELAVSVREAGVGATLVYTVERSGQSLQVPVRTMLFTADILWDVLPGYFASSAIFLAVGVFVYQRNPAAPLCRYLLAYLLVWAIGGAIVWESYLSLGKWMGRLLVPYAIVAPVAGWIFFWRFSPDAAWQRFLARVPVIRTFVLVGAVSIVAMSLLRLLTHALDVPALWRVLVFVDGWPYFVVFGLGSIVVKAFPLVRLVTRSPSRLLRQQAMVMLIGLLVGLAGWYLYLWAPAAVHIAPISRVQWGSLIPAVYPLSIAYAVLRYRLLDISVVVRKGLIYSLLTATLTAVFILLSLLVGLLFESLTDQPPLLAMAISAVVVALLSQPVRGRIQAFVDRAFFRRDEEVRQTLTAFSRTLSTLRTRAEVVQLVRDTITRVLGAGSVTLWTGDGGRYVPGEVCDPAAEGLAVDDELGAWFRVEGAVLLPLRSGGSAAAEALRRGGTEVAVPLFVGEALIGVLTLSARRSGEPYRQADLDLLTMLGQSAALALENARLSEERVDLVRQQFIQAAQIQEEERRRIARDLHDGVGATLAGLSLRLHRVRRLLEAEQSPTAGEVAELASESQAGIRDIRRLVYDLRPAVLDELGLVPALREFLARYERDQGVSAVLSAPDDVSRLPSAVETTLFRIVQEALTNVSRHAEARRVEVCLTCVKAYARLEVADDGRGFDAAAPTGGSHMGLWSMQKRVEQFGGSFEVDSAPGRGTRVVARIPLDNGWVEGSSRHGQDQHPDR